MNDLFFGFQLEHEKRVLITPVLCADGKWRWCVTSFEDIDEGTPAFLACDDPEILFNTTDVMEHPENWGDME